MSIEALKEQARRHEQKEEWRKALDLYQKAIEKLAEDEQPDIGLYNRVGDLFVRVGDLDAAVEHYEKAVDLYLEAYLPNNAIAVCKKVVRNVPERASIYLKMGQIRAEQGFLAEARTNFLTYAERMQQAGDLDESFRALVEFCDLAPKDVDVRIAVAEQMASHERTEEAVAQFARAYQVLMEEGEADRAADVEQRVRELDPDAVLAAPTVQEPGEMIVTGSSLAEEGAIVADFGEISFGGDAEGEEEAVDEAAEAVEAAVEESSFEISLGAEEAEEGTEAGQEEAVELSMPSHDEEEPEAPPSLDGSFDIALDGGGDGAGEEEEGEAVELPMMSFDDEEDEGEAPELPMMSFDDEEDEGEAAELPMMSFDDEDEGEATELPMMSFDDEDEGAAVETEALDAAAFGEADHGERETQEYVEEPEEMAEVDVGLADLSASTDEPASAVEEAIEEAVADEPGATETLESVEAAIQASPDDVSLRQRKVELAYLAGDESVLADAYLGLAQTLDRTGEATRAAAAYRQVLDIDPDHAEAQAALGDRAPVSQPIKEVAAHEEYVDLGSLILGDETEKSTRMTVAYEEPSGDEEADFAKMLSQFKEKVSENLDADDVRAHHDLGTAYKEMGLLDEAVAEFQQALRASSDHLPTYELLGQTFMEMGQADAAARSLERALEADFDVEDELIGIYYHLARAYEELGRTEQALEFYDRVFSLDINFADVTERLRALR